MLKAVARDKKLRFEAAEEMMLALQRTASRPLPPQAASTILVRDPSAVWKIAAATVSVVVNLLLVYWLLFLPR